MVEADAREEIVVCALALLFGREKVEGLLSVVTVPERDGVELGGGAMAVREWRLDLGMMECLLG